MKLLVFEMRNFREWKKKIASKTHFDFFFGQRNKR